MSLQAYKAAATRAENPREMEYRLFGQVTRALPVLEAVLALLDSDRPAPPPPGRRRLELSVLEGR